MLFRSPSTRAVGENFPVAKERKVKKVRHRIILILVALIATLTFAPTANASYQRFLANGLPTASPQAATSAVLAYASLNDGYGRVIAAETGATSFHKGDYRAVGWGVASANTTNSALSGTGSTVPTTGGVGVKTVRIRNTKTGRLVAVMIRCGNPRLHKGGRRVLRVKVLRILRVYVNRKFTVSKTCPTNPAIKATVKGRVKGWFRTRVKGWTTGAKLWYQQKVNLAVSTTLRVTCVGQPKAPPQLPSGVTIIQQTVINTVCGNTTIITGTGNNNVTQGGNCNTVVTQPPCDGCNPPPPPKLNCPPGSTPSENHEYCVKDGSTTPPPPSDAPGPNPPPSPNDPAPGGHACYSETTGQPVDPILVAGVYLCPTGSFGTP